MINRDEYLLEIKEEKRLRKALRRLLENYFNEKQEKVRLDEEKLRHIIRTFILEDISADVATQQPQRTTGINVLETLLKNIIAIVEDGYKELTTSKEQRDSFRAHILNAVENSLKPINVDLKAEKSQEEELEEEVEFDIDVEEEKFIPAREQDEEEAPEEEDEETFASIGGMNVTGRNFASITFNKIENQILDAYESLGDEEDRSIFEDYLLTNLKLYFDRFEEELQPTVPEPESPDYNPEKDAEIDAGELSL